MNLVTETIIEYCKRTKELRGQETQLLLSFVPPHNRVGTDSIARWIKTVLAASGIDTNNLKLTHPEQQQCQHVYPIYQCKILSREQAGAMNKLFKNFIANL